MSCGSAAARPALAERNDHCRGENQRYVVALVGTAHSGRYPARPISTTRLAAVTTMPSMLASAACGEPPGKSQFRRGHIALLPEAFCCCGCGEPVNRNYPDVRSRAHALTFREGHNPRAGHLGAPAAIRSLVGGWPVRLSRRGL